MKPFHFSKLNILFEDTFFLKTKQNKKLQILFYLKWEKNILLLFYC